MRHGHLVDPFSIGAGDIECASRRYWAVCFFQSGEFDEENKASNMTAAELKELQNRITRQQNRVAGNTCQGVFYENGSCQETRSLRLWMYL